MEKRFYINRTIYKLFNKFNIFTREETHTETFEETSAPDIIGFLVEKEYFEREFLNMRNKKNEE